MFHASPSSRAMPSVCIPGDLAFPTLAYDPDDDTVEFDYEAVEALMVANPGLDWDENLLLQVMASWCLREVEAGRPVGPAAAVLGLEVIPIGRH
jgi:hypothetical protein